MFRTYFRFIIRLQWQNAIKTTIYKQRVKNMYSCVLYGQTTDKGNEPDGRKIDYTDKGEGVKIT